MAVYVPESAVVPGAECARRPDVEVGETDEEGAADAVPST